MLDKTGRNIDYMRISVTDRCNLHCKYCMPDNMAHFAHNDILTYEEIAGIVTYSAELGINRIKITGGEPLVRKNICTLVKMLKNIKGIQQVTITTNGILLPQYYQSLIDAGIDGINISLDTLDEKIYKDITGGNIGQVKEALDIIKKHIPDIPIKINTVITNKDNALGILTLARDNPFYVRFIEEMPIGFGKTGCVTADDIYSAIIKLYPDLTNDKNTYGNGPATYYKIPGFCGRIGFISAIRHKFCESCNRIRLTSTGFLKGCLCYDQGEDLRKIIRSDGPGDVKNIIKNVIYNKPKSHCFGNEEQITEHHGMSYIGG